MAKLIYDSGSGQPLVFGDSAPLLVTKIDGLGSVKTAINSQKSPRQDGVSVTSTTLEPRYITIEGQILEPDMVRQQAYREQMLRAFLPKVESELTIERYGTTRTIKCIPEVAPEFPSAMQSRLQSFFLSLICPNPYFETVTESSAEIVTWIGGLRFPLRLPTAFALSGPKKINVVNEGDVETPIRIEIMAPATNPTLTHVGTSEFIRVKQELTEKDVLVITTNFGNKRVEIGGENRFNYIDSDSTFFSLKPGDNILEYTSDDSQENARVKIAYKNRYLGV